jgi:uncharacterized protein YdaU (DUF1376 family)
MPKPVPPLPLPIAPFLASLTLAISGASVHGAVFCIVMAYWQSGCRSLPADDAGLQALARTYGSQWMRVRGDVKQALAEIIPALTMAHAKAVRARKGRAAAARQGGLAKARKMRQEVVTAVASHTFIEPPRDIGRIYPVRSSAYQGNGRTDLHARQASIERERSAGTRVGLLTDSVRRPG